MSDKLSRTWSSRIKGTLSSKPRAVMIGSCFSVEMANRCESHGWEVLSNPMGTLFQPLILADWVKMAMKQQRHFPSSLIVEREGIYRSLWAGKVINASSPEGVQANMMDACQRLFEALSRAEILTVTWGTAYAWNYLPEDVWVGNCQKLPNALFQRELIPLEQIVACWLDLISLLRSTFPHLQVVITVSPVRHEKLGVVENARSKAVLLEAAHRVTEEGDAMYFPSYEWITDELRDYRYYKEDGCHPSDEAIDFVFNHWIHSFHYE
jgi:hypothetical protein